MNNNNKRNKNRPSGGGNGLSRYSNDSRLPPVAATTTVVTNNKMMMQRAPAQGVYSNSFFMHAATALVGSLVQLRLRSGNVYEGVFRTFSSNFDVALDLPQCIQPKKGSIEEENIGPRTVIFPNHTVVNISAKDFDLSYATVGAFQTDAAISEKCNGARFEEKELEPWDPTGLNGEIDIELDNAANGWDVNEMFRKNENTFGVTSTFDDSLSTYTVQIDKKDSDEFKEAEMRAEKLAAEIENNPACRDRLDIENGDEEALFAAVERPSDDIERERERERGDRSELLERERDREHKRSNVEQRSYEPRSEPMPERYIVKPTRSITGPPPPVAMTTTNSISSSSSSTGGGPTSRMHHERNDRNDNSERTERLITTNQASTTTATAPQAGSISNTTQLPPPTAVSMKSSMSTATQATTTSNAPMATSTTSQTSLDNNGNGNGNKYGGGSMMKRKNTPQSGKVVRNTPPPSGSTGNNGGGGGSGGNLAPSGNNNNSGGGKGSNVGNSYQAITMQNQTTYQAYTSVHGPIFRSTHMGNNGNGGKLGSDSNSGKPMNQRGMRQYQGSQPNSAMNYNDAQNQMNKSHGPPQQGGSSPPLQAAPPHGSMVQQQQQQGVMAVQSAPQPQRHLRTRENHMQELRQFQSDFQLAPSSNQAPVMPAQQHQLQSHQQQAQQQQQQQAPSPNPAMNYNDGQNQMNKSHGPPQQQQQQQPPPQHQPQQQQQQQQQQHIPQQPPPQPHPHLAAMPPQHIQQHHSQQQVHYVTAAPAQLVPPQLPPPQQQQYIQAHLVQSKVVQHITGVPQPQQTQIIATGVPLPQQQMPPPPSQQGVIVTQPQISPVIVPASPVLEQSSPVQMPPPQQQQQQQNQINKNETIIVTQVPAPPPPTAQQPQVPQATVTPPSSDKSSTPPTTSATNGNSAVISSTTTAAPKKTHVLNPSAKPFTPRSPSTPNPSRPHTPQTPVPQMANIYTTAPAATPGPNQIYLMQPPPQQTAAAFQAPAHPQGGQQPRLRRNFGPLQAPQFHVSATAATGQPLLAGGPVQQFIQYQHTPHATHFQSQPYATMPIQLITQTQPSTTPSPGQPHQAFHTAPQPSPAGGAPQSAYAAQSQPPCQMPCTIFYPPQLMQNTYYQTTPHPQQQTQPFQILMPPHPAQ